MEEILVNNGDLVKVGVYDYLAKEFYEVIKEAGIDSRRIPNSNLTMYIRAYWVEVEEYGEKTELYDSTTEEDIENIKKQYFAMINPSSPFTLHKDQKKII